MYEDQFDFHGYCLRKTTLRAYVDTIRFYDTHRGHRYHVRAAVNLVKVYLRLYDAPREDAQHFEAMAAESNLSDAEKKEEAKRLRKAAAKAKAAEEKAAAAEAAAKAAAQPKGKQAPKADEDPDPEGALLVQVADPLAEATRFHQHLAAHHSGALQTHTLGVALYVRKHRFLLALRHMLKAIALDAAHPDTHVALASFLQALRVPAALDALHPAVREALDAAVATADFGAGKSIIDLNTAFLAARPASVPARIAAARVLFALDSTAHKAEALKLASTLDAKDSCSRADAVDALAFLVDTLRAPQDTLDSFKAAALQRFPLAVAFGAKPNPPPAIDAPQQ
jgi:hypothetical protein